MAIEETLDDLLEDAESRFRVKGPVRDEIIKEFTVSRKLEDKKAGDREKRDARCECRALWVSQRGSIRRASRDRQAILSLKMTLF